MAKQKKSNARVYALTRLRNARGAMTKTLTLGADGTIQKSPQCQLVNGVAERVEVGSFEELATVVTQLKTTEALCYGVTDRAQVRVVADGMRAAHPDAVARTREFFRFSTAPGVMMFDYDPADEPLSIEDLLRILRSALPALEQVSLMWRPSASSCVFHADTVEELRGVAGVRIWVLVTDASQIPRLGKIVCARLWELGHAEFRVSKSGQMLDRPLFDVSVWQPERIDFAAGAICTPPLVQRLPAPEIVRGRVGALDPARVNDLTSEQKDTAERNRRRARECVTAVADLARREYAKGRAELFAARSGVTLDVAACAIERAVLTGGLEPEFVLLSEAYGEVTVEEVLADSEKFHGTRFADPIEPDYNGDGRIAWANLKANEPHLYSHAHGGQTYLLLRSRGGGAAGGASPGGSKEARDLIDELNDEYGLVPIGRDVVVVRMQVNPVSKRGSFSFLNKASFLTLLQNRPHPSNDKSSMGHYWLTHPKRRECVGVEFHPRMTTLGWFNMFQGFGVQPVPGKTDLWWRFVREVICNGNEEAHSYVRKWLSHMVQRPDELPEVAMVLRGAQGAGKNTFADTIGKLVGDHYVALSSMEHVTGRFNGHMKQALLVFANEAIWGGSRSQVGALKAMITDERISIEQKGIDIFQINNYRRLIVASNESWAVPADADDRRFVFLDVSPARVGDHEYFKALRAELMSGGYEAIMHDLMCEDLTNFNPRARPKTGFGFDIKLRSADALVQWLHEVLNGGAFPDRHWHSPGTTPWQAEVAKADVYRSYCRFSDVVARRQPVSESVFHPQLNKILPTLREKRVVVKFQGKECGRERRYLLPPLPEARAEFEHHMCAEGEIAWEPLYEPMEIEHSSVSPVRNVQGGLGLKAA